MLAWPLPSLGPKVFRRPHFQPLQDRERFQGPKALSPHFPTLTAITQAPHAPALPGPGPSLKKNKKNHSTHQLRPCSSPHSASHTLRAAQARVAVRKWGAALGQEREAQARAQLAFRAWVPRQMLIGCGAGRTFFPGSCLQSVPNSVGGT